MKRTIPIKKFDINVSNRELIMIKVGLELLHDELLGAMIDLKDEDLAQDTDLVDKMITRLKRA